MQYKTASARGDTAAQALHLAEDALPGRLYYGLLDLAALPPGCDWADAQTLGTLLYDKAQPAPELSVFVLDTADHSWAADAASLYEDMKAVEREYDLHCGLQQLFTQADGCAVPAYRADSGYGFAPAGSRRMPRATPTSGLPAQLAAALCGQTGRFFTACAVTGRPSVHTRSQRHRGGYHRAAPSEGYGFSAAGGVQRGLAGAALHRIAAGVLGPDRRRCR